MRSVAVVTLMMIIASGTTGHAAGDGVEMSGVGTQTCAKFASDYRSSADFTENLYYTWAQGYMAGLNMGVRIMNANAKEKSGRDVTGLTLAAQKAFLRDYCNQHPLADYYQGVIQLFGKLPWKREDAAQQTR
jgi:hypothetical protein